MQNYGDYIIGNKEQNNRKYPLKRTEKSTVAEL